MTLRICVALTMASALGALMPPAAARTPPLPSGTYVFQHRYAEQPMVKSFPVVVTIRGRRITVDNRSGNTAVFPAGRIDGGELFWHRPTQQWIIANTTEDKVATEAGGCSGGPPVVDVVRKIYWTC